MKSSDLIMLQTNKFYMESQGFFPNMLEANITLNQKDAIFQMMGLTFGNQINLQENMDIEFNQDIVIRHHKSQRFISATNDQDVWSLQLIDTVNKSCLFRVQPCYKNQTQNSNQIHFTQDIYIQYSPENEQVDEIQSKSEYYLQINQLSKQYQLSQGTLTKFQILFYVNTLNKGIQFNDIVSLHHLQTDSYLGIEEENNTQNFNCLEKEKSQQKLSLIKSNNDAWIIFGEKYYQQVECGEKLQLLNLFNGQMFEIDKQSQVSFIRESKNIELGQHVNIKVQDNYINYDNKLILEEEMKPTGQFIIRKMNFNKINKPHQTIEWLYEAKKQIAKQVTFCQELKDDLYQMIIGQKQMDYNPQKIDQVVYNFDLILNILNDLILLIIRRDDKLYIDKTIIQLVQPDPDYQNLVFQFEYIDVIFNLINSLPWNNQMFQIYQEMALSKKIVRSTISALKEQQVELHSILLFSIKETLIKSFLLLRSITYKNQANSIQSLYYYKDFKQLFGLEVGAFRFFIQLFTNKDLSSKITDIKLKKENQQQFNKAQSRVSKFQNIKSYTEQNQNNNLISDLFLVQEQISKSNKYWHNFLQLLTILCQGMYFNQVLLVKQIEANQNLFMNFESLQDQTIITRFQSLQFDLGTLYDNQQTGLLNKEHIQYFQYVDQSLLLISYLCQDNYSNIKIFSSLFKKQNLFQYLIKSENPVLKSRIISLFISIYLVYPHEEQIYPKGFQLLKPPAPQQQVFDEDKQIEMISFNKTDPTNYDALQEFALNYIKQNKIIEINILDQSILILIHNLIKFKLIKMIDVQQWMFYQLQNLSEINYEPDYENNQELKEYQEQRQYFNNILSSLISIFGIYIDKQMRFTLKEIIQKKIINQPIKYQINIQCGLVKLLNVFAKYLQLNYLDTTTKGLVLNNLNKLTNFNSQLYSNLKFYLINIDRDVHEQILGTKNKIQYHIRANDVIDTIILRENIINLNQQLKDKEEKVKVHKQILFGHLQIDDLMIQILNLVFSQVQEIDSKIKAKNEILTKQEQDLILLVKEVFQLLQDYSFNNQFTKKRLVLRLSQLQIFIDQIDLGYYKLFCVIFQDQISLTHNISKLLMKELIEEQKIGTIQVLNDIVLCQGERQSRNIDYIIQNILEGDLKFLSMNQFDHQQCRIKEPNRQFYIYHLQGQVPYILQYLQIRFLRINVKNSKYQDQAYKMIQEKITVSFMLQLIQNSQDYITDDSDLSCLEAAIKLELFQLLQDLIIHNSSIFNEARLQKEFKQTLEIYEKQLKQEDSQSESGSDKDQDQKIYQQIKQYGENIGIVYSKSLFFIYLFQTIMKIGEKCQELITNQNQGRSVSVIRQFSMSQSTKKHDRANGHQQVTQEQLPLYNISQQCEHMLISLEQKVIENLNDQIRKDNRQLLENIQNDYHMLYQRKLNLKLLPFEFKNLMMQYQNQKYINDNRIYPLIQIYDESQTTPHANTIQHQFQLLFMNDTNQQVELIHEIMGQKDQLNNLINAIIKTSIESLNEFISNANIVIQQIQLLQTIIDLSGLENIPYIDIKQQYQNYQSGLFKNRTQQLQYYRSIQDIQNYIVESGFFKLFSIIFSRQLNFDEYYEENLLYKRLNRLRMECIKLIIKLIGSPNVANTKNQFELYKVLSEDTNNQLIEIIHEVFTEYCNQNQSLEQQIRKEIKLIKFSYQRNDSHILEPKGKQSQICLFLHLIQILCEDHNRSFQNFFREQTSYKISYDIVEEIIQIIRKTLPSQKMDKISFQEYQIICLSFDCLKELVQGPCMKNQQKLCQEPFLLLVSRILNYDDSHTKFLDYYSQLTNVQEQEVGRFRQQSLLQKQKANINLEKTSIQQRILNYYISIECYANLIQDQFQQSNQDNYQIFMLSQIKYRCTSTLESLIDTDDDQQLVILKIASFLDEQRIIENLKEVYIKFKLIYFSGKNYTNQVFNHLQGQAPFTKNQSKDKNNYSVQMKFSKKSAIIDLWKSLIIETGFSLYTILAYIYQVKEIDVLERIHDQIDHNKQKKKRFRDFFVVQIYNFLYQASQLSKTYIQKNQIFMYKRIFRSFILEKADKNLDAQDKKIGYRALRFFTTRSGSIEIELKNKQLRRVIFPLMPHCFVIDEQIKDKFQSSIDRLSAQTKLESVVEQSQMVIDRLKVEYRFLTLYRGNLLMNLFASNTRLWKQIIFILIVIENLLVLFSSNGSQHDVLVDVTLILNIIQIILQCICFIVFIIKKSPYLIGQARQVIYKKQLQRVEKREIKYLYQSKLVSQEDELIQKSTKFMNEQQYYRRLYYNLVDDMVYVKYILFNNDSIYFFIFTTFAVFGLFYKIALAALLLDVFWRFPTLTNIVNSIWRPRDQIFLMLVLFFILQYYYSLIMFSYYQDAYYPMCTNLTQCFSFIYDVTFKIDGGVVGYFLQSENQSKEHQDPNYNLNFKSLLEFLYVFVIISLVYSIITGIIIDTFGILRDERQALEEDVQGYCLICGIDKGTIEKKVKHQKGFRFHVKYEHYVWNYIFYISYLQDKKPNEYNGIESYTIDKLNTNDINWLPQGRCLAIASDVNKEEIFIINMLKKELLQLKLDLEEKINEIKK